MSSERRRGLLLAERWDDMALPSMQLAVFEAPLAVVLLRGGRRFPLPKKTV